MVFLETTPPPPHPSYFRRAPFVYCKRLCRLLAVCHPSALPRCFYVSTLEGRRVALMLLYAPVPLVSPVVSGCQDDCAWSVELPDLDTDRGFGFGSSSRIITR